MLIRLGFITFLLWSYTSHSQSSPSLDTLSSFQGFGFGSAPEEAKGSLKLDLTISYGLKYYKFSSKKHRKIYKLKVHEMNIGYQDDQLEYIDIYFNELKSDEVKRLIEQLESIFGKSEVVEAFEKGVVESYRWDGTSTTLDLYRYGSEVISLEEKNKTVLAISRPLK